MNPIPHFLQAAFVGFEITQYSETLENGIITVHLERAPDKDWVCHRCGTVLGVHRGKYPVCLDGMPIMGFNFKIYLWRLKGECHKCQKARAERVEFIAEETPHLTRDYAYWVGRLCEMASVSRVAEFIAASEMSVWRLDFARMRCMLSRYKIPRVTRIAVDEVYVRRKPKYVGESRNKRFFTVITDLDTRKVIWVSESRDRAGLDEFFAKIGEEACKEISVVATDQHEEYAWAVKSWCPNATLVWDRFHIMQNFEKAMNETRKELHESFGKKDPMKDLTRGKYRFLFLKKATRRTEDEQKHIEDVMRDNDLFLKLELIKERMLTFFDQEDMLLARYVFHDVGRWIIECQFEPLKAWWLRMNKQWGQLSNYFQFRVTTAVCEGFNNVIKMLKRRAFGFRNMEYFRLKIMQTCGYLNSRYIHPIIQPLALM